MGIADQLQEVAWRVRKFTSSLQPYQKLAAREALEVVDGALSELDRISKRVAELEDEVRELKRNG